MSEQGTSDQLPLTFDAWAELSARLLKRSDKDCAEILERHGLDPDDWSRLDRHYKHVLADDISEGDGGLAKRYGATCIAELARRKAEREAPPPPPPEQPPPAVEPAVPATTTPDPHAVPSYLRGFDAGAAPIVAASRAKTLEETPQASLASTIAALPRAPGSATLPFGGAPSPEFVASLAASAREATPRVGGETLPLGANLMAQLKATLPFAKPPAPSVQPVIVPQLTLEAYASLCVELAVYPDRSREVMKRYNLADEATMQAVDVEWQRRLKAHPDTHQRWSELYVAYRDWLLHPR